MLDCMTMLDSITRIRPGRSGRSSSWDRDGGNDDAWNIPAGETRVLADITGPGRITHLWLTQRTHYRECRLCITFDDAPGPQVDVPLGDFFCLGNSLVANFQSLLFTASTNKPNSFDEGCALNCYAPMPFRRRAVVELVNESEDMHRQYFYVDYERYATDEEIGPDEGYFHAEFRRCNPFAGWGHDVRVNVPELQSVPCTERWAYDNNYVILDTQGEGHYIGCNISVSNFQGTWWGEGDDMIWVDGYHWPPDLHGTGSEDYLNQAWGMQDNAFLRNGSSIFERNTDGYQTSYVFHLENPVRFTESLKVTIEHGHANHLANEMSSVAYWYARRPSTVVAPPPVAQRLPVLRDNAGHWLHDPQRSCPGPAVQPTDAMRRAREDYLKRSAD